MNELCLMRTCSYSCYLDNYGACDAIIELEDDELIGIRRQIMNELSVDLK